MPLLLSDAQLHAQILYGDENGSGVNISTSRENELKITTMARCISGLQGTVVWMLRLIILYVFKAEGPIKRTGNKSICRRAAHMVWND